jgi:hypothetical protein
MRLSDQPALQRIDSAYHTPFLSACASALSEEGLLSEWEADQLRMILKDRHRNRDDSSLFTTLLGEKNPAVTHLQARFGLAGLNEILFRWTSARAVEDLNLVLWSLAQDLIKKAELMFNQTFFLYAGERCERRTLFSFFLVELASEIHDEADRMHLLAKTLRRLKPGGVSLLQEESTLEAVLAEHLGFELESDEGLHLWRLQKGLKALQTHLSLIGDLFQHAISQLLQNLTMKDSDERLKLLLDDWVSILGQLQASSLYWPASLEIMETKRLRLMASLVSCKEIVMEMHHVLLETLKTSRIKHPTSELWPDAEKREILSRMLARGVAMPAAEMALESLQKYCQQHHIAPQQLLDAELQRIDSQLDHDTLHILKKMAADKGVGAQLNQEKQIVLRRKDQLMNVIQDRLTPSLIAILIAFAGFLPGCGVKTAPHSDVLDLRPSVPYHAQQRGDPPKKTEAAPPPKK